MVSDKLQLFKDRGWDGDERPQEEEDANVMCLPKVKCRRNGDKAGGWGRKGSWAAQRGAGMHQQAWLWWMVGGWWAAAITWFSGCITACWSGVGGSVLCFGHSLEDLLGFSVRVNGLRG